MTQKAVTKMKMRAYRESDAPLLAALFYDTVHTVNARDYTTAQLDAWAPQTREPAAWAKSFQGHVCLVAEEDGVIVGFADMDVAQGYLDRLYVHKDHQRRGIATALCDALEALAAGAVTVQASLTAEPFFRRRGYRLLVRQTVERGGVALSNAMMRKERAPAQKT